MTRSIIVVEKVPVGSVAVVVRAGHYVEGCATMSEVVEGGSNRLLVPVNDRPIQLLESELDLKFGFDSVSSEWSASIGFVIEAARTAMLNGAADDFDALLNTMQGSLSSSQAKEFAALRSERSWDLVLAEQLGEDGRDLLRVKAEAWMREGRKRSSSPTRSWPTCRVTSRPRMTFRAPLTPDALSGHRGSRAGGRGLS